MAELRSVPGHVLAHKLLPGHALHPELPSLSGVIGVMTREEGGSPFQLVQDELQNLSGPEDPIAIEVSASARPERAALYSSRQPIDVRSGGIPGLTSPASTASLIVGSLLRAGVINPEQVASWSKLTDRIQGLLEAKADTVALL